MFEQLAAAVREAATLDADALCDDELSAAVVELGRLSAALDAAKTRLTGVWDKRRCWNADGARSAGAWLASRGGLPIGLAAKQVRLGRSLDDMAHAAAAWLAGDIGVSQVDLLAKACTPVTAEHFGRDEKMLVDHARSLSFKQFKTVLDYWCQLADPDGVEDEAAAKVDRRSFHLSQTLDGMWYGDLVSDPISGAVVSNELARIEKMLFEADWADARARVGEQAMPGDLRRTPAQRRHDALVEMARRSATAPADGKRPAPLFTVLVGYETFAGRILELANGTVVTPGSLVPWLTEADIERVVFASPSRVIDVGERRRLFNGALRRAIEVRDRTCYHDTCEQPAEHCQADHIVPWATGGPTTQANGRMACPFHNRRRNRERPPP